MQTIQVGLIDFAALSRLLTRGGYLVLSEEEQLNIQQQIAGDTKDVVAAINGLPALIVTAMMQAIKPGLTAAEIAQVVWDTMPVQPVSPLLPALVSAVTALQAATDGLVADEGVDNGKLTELQAAVAAVQSTADTIATVVGPIPQAPPA